MLFAIPPVRSLNGITSPLLSERLSPKALSMCMCMRVYVRVTKGGLRACVCLHVSICICVCKCMCVSHARTYTVQCTSLV